MNGDVFKMDRIWPLTLALILVLLSGSHFSSAIDLGDTRDSVLARHGKPQHEEPDGLITYEWDGWLLAVKFAESKAVRIVYGKSTTLSEQDIAGVFASSGGVQAWRKVDEMHWKRTDGGAIATLAKPEGHLLIIEQVAPSLPVPPIQLAPTVVRTTPFPVPNATGKPSPTIPVNLPRSAPVSHIWFIVGGGVLLLIVKILLGGQTKRRSTAPFYPRAEVPPVYSPSQTIPTPATPTIDTVTWDQFELVIAEIYRRQGYAVEISSGLGADGGVDIKLVRDGEITLVQCKQWKAWKVSVKNIREFYGTMSHEKAQHGIFVSTKEYTRDCREFIIGKPMILLDRSGIQRMVNSAQRPGENIWDIEKWIAEFESSALISTPTCPYCHNIMVLRNANHKDPFWGCPAYPRCRGKRNARHDLIKLKAYQRR